MCFYYHMNGDEQHMGLFNASFIDERGHLHSFITATVHGNNWHQVHISVLSEDKFKVRRIMKESSEPN